MRKAVFDLLNEAQKKMSGFAVYMNYQFIHFSVQAEPAALLAIEVELNNVRMNLEDVADIILPNETQFGIIPKSQSYLFPICKAIGMVHPEYKIEQKSMNDEQQEESPTEAEDRDTDEEDEKYILCTMPEVTKERRDAGMDYVKTIYDETLAKLDTVNTAYGVKIGKVLTQPKANEADEAKEELKKMHDEHLEICKSYREEKENQIEAAYQDYLKRQQEKESAEREKEAAHSGTAGKQFHMDAFSGGDE